MSGREHNASTGPAPHAGSAGESDASDPGRDAPFRKTLARVLLVQVVALILLWLLQSTFHN